MSITGYDTSDVDAILMALVDIVTTYQVGTRQHLIDSLEDARKLLADIQQGEDV